MILHTADAVREGRVVDARDLGLDADAVLAAIRTEEPDSDDWRVAVEAPEPAAVHDRVGHLRSGMDIRVRTALAVAARSRGLDAPQDEERAGAVSTLSELEPATVERADVRRKLAAMEDETARLRERVAELRGRIQERRERGADTDDLESDLMDAVRTLSEAETERAAANQRLDAATVAARDARDIRERRLRLQDRKANLARAARAHLVERVEDEYAEAVAAAPDARGSTVSGRPDDPFAVDGLTAALAVARVADLSAPVVCSCDRFETPAAAAAWLDAPVVRL